MKNRVVVGLICIILSLVVCFGLTPMFNDALTAKVEIVRVSKDIQKGEEITASMVTTVEVGGYNLPSNVVYQESDVIGMYANTDLYNGDYVLTSKLSNTYLLKNEYLSALDGTNRAISLSIKFFAGGLSGKLEQGDIVSLIASDVGDYRETINPLELQYVEVIATTSNDGEDQNTQYVTNTEENNTLASTITVLVSPEQARLIAELEQTGTIHAALVYRGSREQAEKFLEAQALVIEELYSEEEVEEADEEKDGVLEEGGEESLDGIRVEEGSEELLEEMEAEEVEIEEIE